jgi:hypothetical protein
MIEHVNGTGTVRVGSNSPAIVSRVIMLGYYDGATEGVVEFGPIRESYWFQWVDAESPTPATLRRRTYTLRPLPADALERLTAVLSPYITPKWPAWFPIWRFASEEIERDIDAQTDAILSESGSPTWQITTEDPFTFMPFIATRLEPVAATSD